MPRFQPATFDEAWARKALDRVNSQRRQLGDVQDLERVISDWATMKRLLKRKGRK